MPSPSPPLRFQTEFDARTGEPVAVGDGLLRLTAPNAGPFTFTGTNSFIVGHNEVFVIDPGPENAAHENALITAIGGRRTVAILLTHTHKDHCALAQTLTGRLAAPLWFAGMHRLSRPARPGERNAVEAASDWRLAPDRTVIDGDRIVAGGVSLDVVATAGHCANHIAFGVVGTDTLFSGDHVMGWSSTLVSVPDGSMHDYLASLDRLLTLPYDRYLPAHGDDIADAKPYVQALRNHRLARNEQIIAALAEGPMPLEPLLSAIYPEIDARLIPAARMTIMAHLDYLAAAGLVSERIGAAGDQVFETRLASS